MLTPARSSFPISVGLEAEARAALDRFTAPSVYGVKCWYCDAELIERGAERAFIGINPGGKRGDDVYDQRKGYLEAPYERRGFNAWLDEVWPDGNPHQAVVAQVFGLMYGDASFEATLRRTACFNVCPYRTRSLGELPVTLWHRSKLWARKVLEQVGPKFIICNGSGMGRSPWAVVNELFHIEPVYQQEVQANGFIREGTVRDGPLRGARVLALPFLKRFWGIRLSRQLEEIARHRPFA